MTSCGSADAKPSAIFFDVDFTLIYPGQTFEAEGYQEFCAAHGITVDPARHMDGIRQASALLDTETEHVYDDEVFVRFIRRVIEAMGGTGDRVNACAREMWAEWASCYHFRLYDDVQPALRMLADSGLKIGLISNSHRCLATFEEHFELEGLIAGAVSSSAHGYLKPHASIFEAALRLLEVDAAESVMVGDSLAHDIRGALAVGMRGVLVHRSADPPPDAGVPVIRSLMELPRVLAAPPAESRFDSFSARL